MDAKANDLIEETVDREIVVTRVFDAPPELVWEAWTKPEHVVRWWGPRGFTTTIQEMDVRPGGVWRLVMHGPDGTDYPNRTVFTEVVPPQRLAYTNTGGRKGGPAAQFQMIATFDPEGEKTRVTMRMVFPSAAEREKVVREYGALEGARDTMDRLGEHLATVAKA